MDSFDSLVCVLCVCVCICVCVQLIARWEYFAAPRYWPPAPKERGEARWVTSLFEASKGHELLAAPANIVLLMRGDVGGWGGRGVSRHPQKRLHG